MEKIIVILGQTSTGKSDFAVEIAKQINGEIISADSRQVYKGMDLGTGKITKKEMRGIKHHLLDVISPQKVFSVNDFVILASKKIKEIIARKKVPIICGGTGFYIDSLINGSTFPEVLPNKKLREELYRLDAIALIRYLEKLDPQRAKTIDKNNSVRLIRAIEIAKALGKVPTSNVQIPRRWTSIKIGLVVPDEILKERIYNRIISRIKKGMLKEIEYLHKKGLFWKRMNELGLEYRYGALYFQNKISKKEMIQKLNTETWHYAKRQKTWFKRDKEVIWVNPSNENAMLKSLALITKFLK